MVVTFESYPLVLHKSLLVIRLRHKIKRNITVPPYLINTYICPTILMYVYDTHNKKFRTDFHQLRGEGSDENNLTK